MGKKWLGGLKQEINQYGESCFHHTVFPIEYIYGCRRWNQGKPYIDWSSNIINAHVSRVSKVYCPDCGYQFDLPSDSED